MDVYDLDTEPGECIHGMYPASTCYYCNGHAKADRVEAEKLHIVRTFEAEYKGRCNGGSMLDPAHYIEVGDMICVMSNDQFWCEGCARKATGQ